MELSAFHLDDVESIFSSHITPTFITLMGSPKPIHHHRSSLKPSPDSTQDLVTPRHPRLPLSPSYTPVEEEVKVPSQSVPPTTLFTIQEDSSLLLRPDSHVISRDHLVKSQDGSEKNSHVAKWLSQTKPHAAQKPSDANRATNKPSSQKKMVYLSKGFVLFPKTTVGSFSTFKVRVCNRDSVEHSLEVIKPSEPFTVSHQTFNLGSRMCARLPVHFSPKYAGEFEAILAIRTHAGHQTFAQIRGRAVPEEGI